MRKHFRESTQDNITVKQHTQYRDTTQQYINYHDDMKSMKTFHMHINPLLPGLFLDHDVIFYF